MTEVLFYHMTRAPLDAVLPNLLARTLERGKRAVVMTGSEERAEALDTLLWTYDPASFLPHGTARDGEAADQPVWLTVEEENPNAADYLFLTDGAHADSLDGFERCVILFDGGDERAVGDARARWKALKDQGHELTYWQQNDAGRWEEQG